MKLFPITRSILSPLKTVALALLISFLVVVYCIMYLGTLWSPAAKLSSVPVAILNQDQGFAFALLGNSTAPARIMSVTSNQTAGEFLTQAVIKSAVFQIIAIPPSTPVSDLHGDMETGRYWGYLTIPPNFSNALLSNLWNRTSNQPAETANAMVVTFSYNQARQLSVTGLVATGIKQIVTEFSLSFAGGFIKEALAHPDGYSSLLVTPSFVAKPITLAVENTHPVPYWGLNFATYIPLVVMWILGMVTTTLFFRLWREAFDQAYSQSPVYFAARFLLSGFLISVVCNFLIAVWIWLMLLILAGNQSFVQADYTSGQVIAYLWLIACCFQSFSAFFASLIGVENFNLVPSLLLILQLATSSAILDPVVEPDAARITYAFPLHYGVQGLRCFFLGSQCNDLSRDTWVPGVWFLGLTVGTLALLFRSTVSRIKANKDAS
ncbi:hypothetical protein HDU91_001857 [Kappamyces sp. JEL0680]|nr:hypothetical protein HDU91_001857 [Kappamyces sp. JEL0680]